jgi:hypothetical protein
VNIIEALQRIAAIKNKDCGGDWDEIEEARSIALAALKAHQQAVEGVELPPLPEPFVNAHEEAGASYPDTFSGYQMHAYARDAIAAHQARAWIDAEPTITELSHQIQRKEAENAELRSAIAAHQARQGVPQGYMGKFIGKGAGIARRFYNGEDQSVVSAGDWMLEAIQLLQLAAAPQPEASKDEREAPTAKYDKTRKILAHHGVKDVHTALVADLVYALAAPVQPDAVAQQSDSELLDWLDSAPQGTVRLDFDGGLVPVYCPWLHDLGTRWPESDYPTHRKTAREAIRAARTRGEGADHVG